MPRQGRHANANPEHGRSQDFERVGAPRGGCRISGSGGDAVAALHQGAPGQMTWLKDRPPWLITWLEDPPPWLRPAAVYCFASECEQKIQVAQLSQRDRAAGWVSYSQKWKTGSGREYTDIIGLS